MELAIWIPIYFLNTFLLVIYKFLFDFYRLKTIFKILLFDIYRLIIFFFLREGLINTLFNFKFFTTLILMTLSFGIWMKIYHIFKILQFIFYCFLIMTLWNRSTILFLNAFILWIYFWWTYIFKILFFLLRGHYISNFYFRSLLFLFLYFIFFYWSFFIFKIFTTQTCPTVRTILMFV